MLLLLIIAALVKTARCDYECLCSYDVEKPVYFMANTTSQKMGYMYEFDCKPTIQDKPVADPIWAVIAFENKVGYTQMDQHTEIVTCPGDPSMTDIVMNSTVPSTEPSMKTMTIPTSTIPSSHGITTDAPVTNTRNSTRKISHSTFNPTTLSIAATTLSNTQNATTGIQTSTSPGNPTSTTPSTTLSTERSTTSSATRSMQSIASTSPNTTTRTKPSTTTRTSTSTTPGTTPTTTSTTTSTKPSTTTRTSTSKTSTTPNITSTITFTEPTTITKPTTRKTTGTTPTTTSTTTSSKPSTTTRTSTSTTPSTTPTTTSSTPSTTSSTTLRTTPSTTPTSTIVTTTKDPTECPYGWSKHDGSCYLFHTEDRRSWNEAMSLCNRHHSHLAYIETEAENNYIVGQLKHKHVDLHHGDTKSSTWIGGSDEGIEKLWVWYGTDQPIVYSNWYHGEPDSGDGHHEEDCMCIVGNNHWKWQDHRCEQDMYFICERPPMFAHGPQLVG